RPARPIEHRIDRALHRPILGTVLDDQVGVPKLVVVGREVDAGQDVRMAVPADLGIKEGREPEALPDVLASPVQDVVGDVEQDHPVPGLGQRLCHARTDGPGADNTNLIHELSPRSSMTTFSIDAAPSKSNSRRRSRDSPEWREARALSNSVG